MQLFGRVTEGLGTALDLYQARHQVLAENIANSETPGYRARDLQFADQLAAAVPGAGGASAAASWSANWRSRAR